MITDEQNPGNVEDLKFFADIIGDIENQCDDALRHLNWDFSSFLADLPGVSPKRVKEVEEIYRNVIKKYQAKLDHAQQLVKHTEAAMRQAEKNIGDKAGEFGLEMLGYYDVQRVFGEYDPITGEKVSGVDRLFATGMLALSLYPPGKAVGVTGKVAIKGVNAGTKTGTKFGLSSFAKSPKVFQSLKNVVSTGKVLEVFKGVYKQVVEAPLAATKLWMDRTVRQIADLRIPDFGLQRATAMGALPLETVGEAFGAAKDTIVKMVKTREVPVVTKGIDNPLLTGEEKVGTYQELIDAGTRGDNITPHHMPSAKYMKTKAEVHKNDGVSMNMEHPHPGKGGRHRQTETYGMTGLKLEDYLNLEPRDALARDIIDVRNIYIKEGLYTPEIRLGLIEVIKLNERKYPNIFNR